jgi:hypothetical protein
MALRAHLSASLAFLILSVDPCAARGEAPKACDLLNAQMAASLAGGPVNAPFDLQGIGCSYTSKSGAATVGLTITDAEKTTPADFQRMQQTTAMQQGAKTETIPGVGEHNFYVERVSQENGLVVLYHQKMLSLGLKRQMTPALKAQMIQMMKQFLAKI